MIRRVCRRHLWLGPDSILARLLPIVVVALAAGCGRPGTGVPVSIVGRTCASCGMEVRNPRFAALTIAGGEVRTFDSIECALRDLSAPAARGATRRGVLYLADYESGGLHRSDSLWVLRATIPSPMGGGLAAFLHRPTAERIAAERAGRVTTAVALLAESRGTP